MKQQVLVYQVWWLVIDWFDLPKLSEFTAGERSFYKTTSLSLSSILIAWFAWFDLPKLNTMSVDYDSFADTRSITLSSFSFVSSSSDVPFSNGHYSISSKYNNYTFRYITSSSITSDSTSSQLNNCILKKGSWWSFSCFLHTITPLRWYTSLRRVVSMGSDDIKPPAQPLKLGLSIVSF